MCILFTNKIIWFIGWFNMMFDICPRDSGSGEEKSRLIVQAWHDLLQAKKQDDEVCTTSR